MSFSSSINTTQSSQSISQLHIKRESFQKQIRRQRIQVIKREKRKQLFKNNERYFVSETQINQRQQNFLNYIQSLTPDTLLMDPNSHLTYLNQLILSERSCSWVRNKLGVVLTVVYQMVRKRVNNARERISFLKDKLQNLPNHEQFQCLQSQTFEDTIIYNEVFFCPMNNMNQLYFKEVNPYNPLGQNQDNEANQRHLEALGMSKINIELFLEFLIAVLYEITPNQFFKSLKENHVCSNPEINFLYSHDLFSMRNGNNYHSNNKVSQKQPQTNLMILILNDLSKMLIEIYKVSHNMRYMIGGLDMFWKRLKHLYENQPIQQENDPNFQRFILPSLWFDVEKMFVKQSTKSRVTLRILQFFVNMTSHISCQNQTFDRFIHEMCLLGDFESIVRQLGLELQEYELISQMYGNLVEEEITWSIKNKEYVKEIMRSQIEIEQECECNENAFPNSPGVYTELLEMMNNNWQVSNQKDELLYIVKTILEKYDVPTKSGTLCNREDEIDYKSSQKLIMYEPDVQRISYIIADLFHTITTQNLETQFLIDLFIVVCTKLLPYMLHLSQLSDILAIVIRNQNKRIFVNEKKAKNSLANFNTVDESEKKKKIMTQNIRHMIKQCSEVMWVFYKETKQLNPKSNDFSMDQLGQTYSEMARNFIISILLLWQQNQLEYCYDEFVVFIEVALTTFPEYLILVQNNPDTDQKLIYLVEELGSQCQTHNLEHQFVTIVQKIMTQLCKMDMKSTKKDQSRIRNYFLRFKDEWQKVLQCLEAVMTGTKCVNSNTQLAFRVHQVYEITQNMYKDSLQYQQIQI